MRTLNQTTGMVSELYVVPAAEVSAIVKEREKNVNNVSLKVLREKYSRDFIETIKIFK